MNPFSLQLDKVRILEILGTSDRIEIDDEGQDFKAQFKAEFTSPIEDLKKGSHFTIKLTFTGKQDADAPPFFLVSVSGKFKIREEDAIPVILSKTGPYIAASYLFPFVRSLSVPILEHLFAADLDFPFHMPPPPDFSEPKPPAKKVAGGRKAPTKKPEKKNVPAS